MKTESARIEVSSVRSAQIKTVIEVVAKRGNGTKEDPFREVTEYWSLEGELLAVRDCQEIDSAVPEELCL